MTEKKSRRGLLARWDAHNQRVLLEANQLEQAKRARTVVGPDGCSRTVEGDIRWEGWAGLPPGVDVIVGVFLAIKGHAEVRVGDEDGHMKIVRVRWPGQLPQAVAQVEEFVRSGSSLPGRIGW